MTDNEFIKALEQCMNPTHCGDCKLTYGCEDCFEFKSHLLPTALTIITRQKAEIARLKELCDDLARPLAEYKAEAIKEFAERMKIDCCIDSGHCCEYIDNLVKEMVGEDQ